MTLELHVRCIGLFPSVNRHPITLKVELQQHLVVSGDAVVLEQEGPSLVQVPCSARGRPSSFDKIRYATPAA
jgi:hypothetical protein